MTFFIIGSSPCCVLGASSILLYSFVRLNDNQPDGTLYLVVSYENIMFDTVDWVTRQTLQCCLLRLGGCLGQNRGPGITLASTGIKSGDVVSCVRSRYVKKLMKHDRYCVNACSRGDALLMSPPISFCSSPGGRKPPRLTCVRNFHGQF
jgi:hypothetical protein